MISARKLTKLARKWQKLAAIKGKRITLPRNVVGAVDANSCSTSSMIEKGHFVVYFADRKGFVLPLEYLKKDAIRDLFKLAKEEFTIPSSEPLTLPCDATFMECVISLIKSHFTKEVEKALVMSIASGCCPSSSHLYQESRTQHSLICSF